jgi:predicted transcriptional regulator
MGKTSRGRDIPPPLELLCLKALWGMEEATVRQVREALEDRRLAYTTVMTLLERLVRKGAVARRKEGRAFVYVPQVSREALRRVAFQQFLSVYFDGSVEILAAWLSREPETEPESRPQAKLAGA